MAKATGLFGFSMLGMMKDRLESVGGRVRAFGRKSQGKGARLEGLEGRQLMAAVPAWVNTFGSAVSAGDLVMNNRVNDVAIDASGNVYVTGEFCGGVDFDFGVGTQLLWSTYATNDGYVAKYNADGSLAWVSQFANSVGGEGVGGSAGRALAVDTAGNVYIAGMFTDTMTVDFVSGSKTMTSTGESDVFVAKVTAAGALTMIKQFYGLGSENITQFVGSQESGITLMGMSTGVMDLDVTSKEVDLAAPLNRTVSFVAQYDGGMNLLSYVAARGTGAAGTSEFASADFVPGTKTLIVAANCVGTGEVFTGGGLLGSITASALGEETFVASVDMSAGPVVNWGRSIASTDSAVVSAVTADKDGNVYLGINVKGTADLNPEPGKAVAYLDAGTQAQMVIVSLDRDGLYRGMAATGPDGIGEIKEMIVRPDPANPEKSVVAAVGTFTGTVQFDPAGTAAGVRTSASPAGFVWHLRADGTLLDAGGFYANANGVGTSKTGWAVVTSAAVVNGSDALILGGMFTGEVDFDASMGKTLVNSGSTGAISDGFFGRFVRTGVADPLNDIVVPVPTILVTGGLGVTITNNDTTPSVLDGTDFGVFTVGSGTISVTFTVNNIGKAALILSDFTRPVGFGLSDGLSTTIEAGKSDSFTLTFGPSTEGTFSGDVSFKTNIEGMETFHFSILGKTKGSTDPGPLLPGIDVSFGGQALVDGDATPSAGEGTQFVATKQGQDGPTATFKITNDGDADLTVGSINMPTGFMLIGGYESVLGTGESTTFTVRLNTEEMGTFAGDVMILTNATGEEQFNFRVEGKVVSPLPDFAMTLSADEEGEMTNGMGVFSGTHFGNGNYVGGTGATQSFVVTNMGSQILLISNFKLPAGLKVVDPIAASLLPGTSDTFTLAIDTTKARVLTGDVTFTTNAPGNEAFKFAVAGTVAAQRSPGGSFTLDGKSTLADRTFFDELGNKVVFALTGPGELTVEQSVAGNLLSLGLWGTDVSSGLSVAVTKDAKVGKSTGITTIGHVEVSGAIGSFVGGSVNLTGGFKAEGAVKVLTLNDLTGGVQQTVSIGGTDLDRTAMTLGRVSEATITTTGTLASFKAVEWLDQDSTEDVLTANALGAFSVTGRAKSATLAALAGDMMADIHVPYGDFLGAPLVTSITVAGSGDGDWDLGALKANSVTVKGNVTGKWTADRFGSVSIGKNALTLEIRSSTAGAVTIKGGAEQFDLYVTETLTSLTVTGLVHLSDIAVGGKSGAISLGSMKESDVFAGDYLASLWVPTLVVDSRLVSGGTVERLNVSGWQGGGFNTMGKMSSVTVTGAVTDSKWIAQAGFGAISITGDVTGLTLETVGLTSFKANRVKNTTFDVFESLGSVTVVDWQDGSVKAGKIGTITTKGLAATKVSAAAAGVFTGDVKVTGEGFGSNVNVLGGASITGGLNDAQWEIFGKSGAIVVGEIRDTNLMVHGDLAGFTSKGWAEATKLSVTDGLGAVSVINWLGGSIDGAKMASVTVKGRVGSKTVEAIAGNFSGSLDAFGGTTGLVLGALTVAGTLSGTVDVFGNAGAVTVGSATGASINVTDDVASFTSKGVVSGSVFKSGGNVGAVSAIDWQGGAISAEKVASVTIKGQAGSKTVEAIAGNFSGSLDVWQEGVATDEQMGLMLGALTVAGTLSGAVDVMGKIGAVTVGRVSATSIRATSDLASFTSKGQVSDLTLESGGSLGVVSAISWLGGSISADKVLSITTKGQLPTKTQPVIAGDFFAKVVVSGEGVGSKAATLGAVTIAGTLRDSLLDVGGNVGAVTIAGTLRDSLLDVGGNVGAVTVGAIVQSTLLAGADESGFKVLDEKTGALSTLASFTVTGKAVGVNEASFVNSRVTAGTLANVSLKLVDMGAADVNGFVAGVKIGTYSRVTGLPKPNDVVKVANKMLPGVYDGMEGVGYSLRNVADGVASI